MYKKELERVRPEEVGLSSRALLQMVKELEECGTEMHGLMVTRDGKVALECWWAPYTSRTAHICHSMGKSYVGTAVGLACTQGYLHLQDKIVDLFADEIAEYQIHVNENMRKLTIEHVLMMANGMSVHPASGAGLLKNYLCSEFDHEPGTRFLYNTTGSCMLGAAVAKTTGKSVRQYLEEELFYTIGVESDCLEWMAFHENHIHAAPGVASSTENNLRLGLLYLNHGRWEDRQLIDEEWMKRATTRRIRTDVVNPEAHLEDGSGYGYQLWICPEPETFKFSGGHGQDVVMSRRNHVAVSINQAADDGGSRAEDAILSRYLFAEQLPEGPLPDDEEGYQELCAYLAGRKVKNRTSREVPEDIRKYNGIYAVTGAEFHVNTELRPLTDSNVYTDFYDHEDVAVKTVSICYKDGVLELILDDGTYRTRLEASLDGELRPVYSKGAIPIYTQTVSCAYAEGETLVVETKFLQTCFWTRLVFHREVDGRILIEGTKERLHEADPYISFMSEMKRLEV